jgi:hypothetical protein
MAYITYKKTLFFVTSPREANKLPDEIEVLADNFTGQIWNPESQEQYYRKLCEHDFFEGELAGDLAFKARDRINRAPQSLGLIDLKPTIRLTEAGAALIDSKFPQEALLRQMLKFQFPSIYHVDNSDRYHVKPYLELMRFVHELKGLSKVEIALFVMQLIDYRKYDETKEKIENFRNTWQRHPRNISYNQYVDDNFEREIRFIYADEISKNNVSTRESSEVSVSKFISTKKSNQRDYADASIRYLRATGLFTYDATKNKVKVIKDKETDVEYLLENIERAPFSYTSSSEYKEYLFNPTNIKLLSDDKKLLLDKLANYTEITDELRVSEIINLKELLVQFQKEKVEDITEAEINLLKNYEKYNDVVNIFEKIQSRGMVDRPLYLEWNTWRAFNMLDDGQIKGNFVVDDEGMPLYTASGNKPDIECQYTDFEINVEVTMSSGNRQYEQEGESVARHLGIKARETDKDVYCIFIAPVISGATLAHYYNLHKTNIAYYGGKSKIIPLDLETFQEILQRAYTADHKPTSVNLKRFVSKATEWAHTSSDEVDWFSKVKEEAVANF